jgi:hypothetical protein
VLAYVLNHRSAKTNQSATFAAPRRHGTERGTLQTLIKPRLPEDWTDFEVHLGLSWIEVEASTVEIDGGFEVFTVPVAADSSLN